MATGRRFVRGRALGKRLFGLWSLWSLWSLRSSVPLAVVALLRLQDSIDRRVEHLAVRFEIDAARVWFTAHGVKPAFAVRFFADQLDLLSERGVAAGEGSIGNAVEVGDRL